MTGLLLVIVAICVLVMGYVTGLFFKVVVLMILSTLSVAVFLILFVTKKELEFVFAVFFGYFAIAFNLSMWTTYYFTSGEHWVGDLFRSLLR